ncbi:hypothetical protein GCM10027346_17420 [Hymenobacter seoulensis]
MGARCKNATTYAASAPNGLPTTPDYLLFCYKRSGCFGRVGTLVPTTQGNRRPVFFYGFPQTTLSIPESLPQWLQHAVYLLYLAALQ